MNIEAFETLLSIASDLYKDVWGKRPSHLYSTWISLSYDDLEAVVDDLADEVTMYEAEQALEAEYWARHDLEEKRLDYLFEN